MWANYNYTDFPVVYVSMVGSLRNNSEYKDFTQKWLQLYEDKKKV